MLRTSFLLVKGLNKTETPIFLSVVCSLFPKAIFLTFIKSQPEIQKSDLNFPVPKMNKKSKSRQHQWQTCVFDRMLVAPIMCVPTCVY